MNPNEKSELLRLLEHKDAEAKATSIDCSQLTRDAANEIYREIFSDKLKNQAALKHLCKTDLFFLLVYGCNRPDIDDNWLYLRCREVQANPNAHLDLWPREHYKSTIITFGLSIKDILSNPEVCIGIFSHTRPIAKGFLEQIKRELEQNTFLQDLFPDVLYKNPKSESPKWSLDSGILVKRKTNPKEATVEAHGLVDGQPTSKHFTILVYDDVVTRESVTTPEQIKKTTAAWELSTNLGAKGGVARYIGTRYHANDTYKTMMDRGSVIPRIHKATEDGTMESDPVFLPIELLQQKRRDQGPYTFACQMMQNPVSDNAMGFKEEWLKYYKTLKDVSRWNKYILIDPASKKKKSSDYTVMLVVALAPDANYYLIDGVRDRMNLTAKTRNLFELHRKYKPKDVGYEEYGAQTDVEHMEIEMERENYRFNITRLGGSAAKEDRISRLVPIFEQARMWLPERLHFVDYEGKAQDLIQLFIDGEFKSFPVCAHDDVLDCLARVLDPELGAKFPKEQANVDDYQKHYASISDGWME